MSNAANAIGQLWPWIVGGASVGGAIWRWWRGRTEPREPRRSWEDPEHILFPGDGPSPRPGRGLARWLSAPVRLTLKEAGEQAMAEEMAGLRDDLKRAMADNRRLRRELDGSPGSNVGSTATDTSPSRPSKPPRPRSPRSGS